MHYLKEWIVLPQRQQIEKEKTVIDFTMLWKSKILSSLRERDACQDNGLFQVTVFPRFCYVVLCNHEYIHCLNHRQAKDYIIRRNETERIWKKALGSFKLQFSLGFVTSCYVIMNILLPEP